jgi:hypothetical protein
MKPRPWLSLLVCLCVLTAAIELTLAAAHGRPPSVISRTDAVADLAALFDAIERIHPAPYQNRSRGLVLADRRQVVAALPEPTADDIRAGRDPVIDRARDCPSIQ